MRLKLRRSVVLPQPDGPMNAVTRFLWICMFTSVMAGLEPYETVTFWTSNTTSWPSCGFSPCSAASDAIRDAAGTELGLSAGTPISAAVGSTDVSVVTGLSLIGLQNRL